MPKQRADAAVAHALDALSPWGLRLASGALVSAAGLAAVAVPMGRALVAPTAVASPLLGIIIPALFGGVVASGGIWIARSDLEGSLAVAVGVWWFLGAAFGAFAGLGLVAYQLLAGASIRHAAVVVSSLGSLGGVGGLLVGRYDAQSQRRRRDLETERERLAEEREKLALLNRIVRHDIGNDLQIISGMASHLDGHVDETGQEYLERVQRTTEEAIEVTEQVRAFVASLNDDGETQRRQVSLERVLDTQIENTREVYREATVAVDGSIPDVAVCADDLLSTVLHNVLANAIEHSDREDPYVEVSVEEGEEDVAISIADDGPGIPAEYRESIGDGDPDDRPQSGLGLYIVGTLVDRYDGSVTFDDREPSGTVVTVRLPIAERDRPVGDR